MRKRTDHRSALLPLTLTALGVVYGDIGTSPLYAIRECFFGSHAVPPTHDNVLGVLSLIIYALVIVISIKYIAIVMRADNQGEGGILALTALVPSRNGGASGASRLAVGRPVLIALGIFGTALLYGDGMITPAISVLSAVEGLEVVTPLFSPYVVPITATILVVLFVIQQFGTHRVGRLFGPIVIVWFLTIAVLGIVWIVQAPAVLAAFNPRHAFDFFRENGFPGFAVLGAVFLVVTGGEAMYADMGHFGKHPIRLAWFGLVLPALVLNYLGQGALLLLDPTASQPFFLLAPQWALVPLVGLATAAAIIASQALISASFSVTRQAIQLGLAPRLDIEHTSPSESRPNLHPPGELGPDGCHCAHRDRIRLLWRRCRRVRDCGDAGDGHRRAAVVRGDDRALAMGDAACRWRHGHISDDRRRIFRRQHPQGDSGWLGHACGRRNHFHVHDDVEDGPPAARGKAHRARAAAGGLRGENRGESACPVPGTAVFMTAQPRGAPPALAHNLRYNKVLHEHVVLLTITTAQVPHVPPDERITFETLGCGLFNVRAQFGFMDDPDVPQALLVARAKGVEMNLDDLTYFLGRETIIVSRRQGMAIWREKLFVLMARNAVRATAFFRLPPERVVELGVQVEM